MSTIQFEDGTKVNFDGEPTAQDIEEVASKLNISKNSTLNRTEQVTQTQPSLLGSVAESIAKPFSEIGNATLGLLGQNKTGVLTPKSVTGGTIAPITSVKQGAGDLLEGASYFTPMGAESLAGRVAQRTLGGYGFDVAQKLQQNKSLGEALTPGIGTLISGVIPFASALVGKLSKGVAAGLSGTSQDVIQRAIDNPNAVNDAIKTYARSPELKQDLVDKAREAVQSFTQAKQNEYGQAIEKLGNQPLLLKDGEQNLLDRFANHIKTFGGDISNGKLSFKNSTLTSQDQSNIKQVWNTINNWTDTTPKGLDNLRQAIGNHINDFKLTGNTRSAIPLSSIKNDLTDFIDKNLPGYKETLSTYGQKSQLAKEVVKELGIGGQAKPTTQLTNVMRLFKKDPSVMEKVTKLMGKQEADKFLNEISGAILSGWIPEGKIGNYARALGEGGAIVKGLMAGNPHLLGAAGVGLAASSPRIVGKTATTLGKLKNAGVGKAITKLGGKTGASSGQ